MPRAKSLLGRLESARYKAFFVVLLMLLNISFTTLSSAVVYADTGNRPEHATEVVNENQTEDDATTEETENEEEAPDTDDLSSMENLETPVVEEEEAPESTNDETQNESQVVANVVVPPLELTDLESTFDCWVRTGITEYSFFVKYDTSEDEAFEAGSTHNQTDPDDFESLLPTAFPSAESSVEVAGWDGTEFDWTLGLDTFTVSLENEQCESPTVGDVVVDNADTQTLESIVNALLESRTICSKVAPDLFDADEGPFTIFAPTNSAIASLVQMPGDSTNELNQLLGNPDELCALIASHVVLGEVVSTDATEDGVTVPVLANDVDGLFVQRIGSDVYVDGAKVVLADQFGSNGVVHVVDSVLLPQSVGTIDSVVTDKTSPALSGSIELAMASFEEMPASSFCVLVRVDGVPYIADVDGMSWSIEEGVVSLNPTKSNTLFDVVVRSNVDIYRGDALVDVEFGCEFMVEEMRIASAATQSVVDVETHGGRLLGLTMSRNVLSYLQPEEPETEEEVGEVLGETKEEVVEDEPVAPAAQTVACGKGACGDIAQAADPSTIDSDGDGVVDSEDPAPFDPDITGLEDAEDSDEDSDSSSDESEEDGDGANVLLWFLLGGGVVLAWYLLWQRSGREF